MTTKKPLPRQKCFAVSIQDFSSDTVSGSKWTVNSEHHVHHVFNSFPSGPLNSRRSRRETIKNSQKMVLLPFPSKFGVQEVDKCSQLPILETQGQLVGATGFSQAKVYNKNGRAPGYLLLLNEFQKHLKSCSLIGWKIFLANLKAGFQHFWNSFDKSKCPGALPFLLQTFASENPVAPTNCLWVSEDANYLAILG